MSLIGRRVDGRESSDEHNEEGCYDGLTTTVSYCTRQDRVPLTNQTTRNFADCAIDKESTTKTANLPELGEKRLDIISEWCEKTVQTTGDVCAPLLHDELPVQPVVHELHDDELPCEQSVDTSRSSTPLSTTPSIAICYDDHYCDRQADVTGGFRLVANFLRFLLFD